MTDQFTFDNPIIPGSIWDKKSDFVVPVVSPVGAGPKGDKGDPAYFDDLTPEQLQEIYQAASFVGNKSFDATVVTSGTSTTVIQIPWVDYDQFDMLFVDVNGLDLAEGDDYTISGNSIVLATPLPAGQDVHFRLLRYDVVDGSKNIVNTMGRKDYNTVAEMQADTELAPGDICHTLGFHAAGDGGAAWYKVVSHAMANGMDTIALDNGYFVELKVDRNTANVLQFGVKNDGTDSCSTIVNSITAEYNLYFPAGKYIVDSTLIPKHAIFGDTYERIEYGNYETQATIFVSTINGTDPVMRLGNSLVTIHDICIKCNDENDGILVKERACLYNIWIWELAGIGINVDPDVGRSRILYADNISIEGARGFPYSTGILINDKAYDSRFTNLEIMRVWRGIALYTISFFSNVHLWGGSYDNGSTQPSDGWKSTSRGIELKSSNSSVPRFVGTNIYIDTFRILISAGHDYSICEINNLTALSDETIDWGSAVIPIFYSNNSTMATLKVNGGFIRYNECLHSINNWNEPARVEISDVVFDDLRNPIYNDYNARNRVVYPDCKNFRFYSPQNNHRNKYLPLAVINTTTNATFDLACSLFEQYFKLHVVTSGQTATVSMTGHNSSIGNSLHYYYDGVYFTVYALGGPTAGNWLFNIQLIEPYSNARLLDRTSMIRAPFDYFYKSIDSLPAGASQITYN